MSTKNETKVVNEKVWPQEVRVIQSAPVVENGKLVRKSEVFKVLRPVVKISEEERITLLNVLLTEQTAKMCDVYLLPGEESPTVVIGHNNGEPFSKPYFLKEEYN